MENERKISHKRSRFLNFSHMLSMLYERMMSKLLIPLSILNSDSDGHTPLFMAAIYKSEEAITKFNYCLFLMIWTFKDLFKFDILS